MNKQQKKDWLLTVSENWMRKHPTSINWQRLCQIRILSQQFIRQFKDYISWDEVSLHQKLSLDFILEFKNKLNLKYIFVNNKFGEKELEEIIQGQQKYKEWLVKKVCQFQILSEVFMKKYSQLLDWKEVVEHQKYNKEFELQFEKEIRKAKYTIKFIN